MARPRKREAAVAAARALASGDFTDIRVAALAHFHMHLNRNCAPFTEVAESERENFRKFVEYVEEEMPRFMGMRRRFAILARRFKRRAERKPNFVQQVKSALAEISAERDIRD